MKPAIQQPAEHQPNVSPPPDVALPRCSYHSPRGSHCHSRVSYPTARLCPRHARTKDYRNPDPSLASELLGDLTEFQSAGEVNQFLSRLLLLLAQDRLSPRRGAVMAYTCNLLLRSLHAIDIENKIAADAPQQVIFDLVRPKRDDDPPPPPSHPTWHASTTDRPQT
jgi:hypothetical protein